VTFTVRGAAKTPRWKIAGPAKRFNANLNLACDTRLFRYHLEVIIPFDRPSRFGRLGKSAPGTQEAVLAAVAARAVLAGVVWSRDDQRFVFYTNSLKWTAKLESRLRAETGYEGLRVSWVLDPDWSLYRRLQEGPEIGTKYSVMLALLVVTGLVARVTVRDAYGHAWSDGELYLLVILFAAFALPRMLALQFPRHAELMAGATAVSVSAAVFALLALTRMPAWAGLVTSLLAGAALVAAVRAAHSSRGRAIAHRGLGVFRHSSAPILRDERVR
jgi:hypothetical protein